jgi:hypothetical protein
MDDDTLLITGVDLDLLEEQRLIMGTYLCEPATIGQLTDEQWQALLGISNMLDEWSDERARKEE